ncbi:glycosyltransferase family 9 protein [Sphingobacteriales bacterium CHB3]|nr:glycosyltransferase family 9 protein [Sphingobacteriales bacterium CHB3]
MRNPRRILVVRTDRIGDVVLATPLIRALRRTFPDAFIGAMVRPYTRDVLLHNPHLNEIIIDDPSGEHAGRSGFWKQVMALRQRRYDTALLLLPTERAAWMLFWAGIPRRVGVGTKLYGVLTFMQGVSRRKYIPLRHEADYCLDLARKIGVLTDDLSTEVFLTSDERKRGKEILREAGAKEDDLLVGFHIGSGNSAPNWEPAKYGELAEFLIRRTPKSLKIIFTDGTNTASLPRNPHLIDLRAKLTLRELMSVLSHERVLFSSSTGPMHIAAALRVPTVSLFCPLTACSPTLWGPKGNDAHVILPHEGYCSKQCPGDPKVCRLDDPSVERVAEILLGRISSEVRIPQS